MRDNGRPAVTGPEMDAIRDRLVARLTMGRELRVAGDYMAAAVVLRAAVTHAEAAFGPDSTQLGRLLNELGIVGKYAGDFVEAELAYRRALAIEDRCGRAGGANAASILHNLAGLAHARGDARAALPLALRGIGIRTALSEDDPGGLAADRAALAAILVDLGEHGWARAVLAQLLHDGGFRYDTAVALHNLGSLQFREGNTAEAAVTLRQALALKAAELGRRHPDLAVTLHNLASCQQRLGKRRSARRHLKQAISILEGNVTEDHPSLAACRLLAQQ